ncbi:MAG: flippase [Flavobacterium sp. BFFFF1]|uniref:lipopolysaccharide biosynthesis protein n=1 Tax=unclassified Flavobacterium TaxID=196869 RepID=UPI000BD09AD7|nr:MULTISPECIES: lipopolysaccharide biosynthesis protein [unclassified Flavobacterium]OYU81522.1 MAG: flippase [Flavobacterium sp. BFFFF1]
MSNAQSKSINAFFWTFMNIFGVQVINFGASIILARILLPAEFGLIGMISIFINIGNSLVDSGMTSSLIRTQNPDQKDYSTVFFMNMLMSVIVYCIAYTTAPFLSDFYGQPILTDLIRVYCLVFIISSFTIIQSTKLNKQMEFKKQLILNIPSLILGSAIGIYMAYSGFGVWSIVWMNLAYKFFGTVQLWFFSKWLPTFEFDMDRLKVHWLFGYKLTLSGLMNTLVSNVYNIIIGRFFSAAQLGFFIRAKSIQELPVVNISNALNKVTYPLFAGIMDDDEKLKSVYSRLIQQVFFWITPLMLIFIVIAEPFFRFLLTEKWVPAVPYFQILCLAGIVMPLNTYNLNILLVKGKSNHYLKLISIKNALTVLGTLLVIPLGINGLIWSLVIVAMLNFFINAHFCGRLINMNVWEQIRKIGPILLLSVTMALLTYVISIYIQDIINKDIFKILIPGTIGFAFYIGMAMVFKFPALLELKGMLKKK